VGKNIYQESEAARLGANNPVLTTASEHTTCSKCTIGVRSKNMRGPHVLNCQMLPENDDDIIRMPNTCNGILDFEALQFSLCCRNN